MNDIAVSKDGVINLNPSKGLNPSKALEPAELHPRVLKELATDFRQQRVVVNVVKSDWAPILSGVPQGIVLGPLLFSLYINGISSDIEYGIRLFADDCVCYRKIKDEEDTMKLQSVIDQLDS